MGHSFDYDLLVIGAGSGGVRASRFAASYGAKAAIVELPFGFVSSDEVGGAGGTCVIRGCVPKKLFVYGSQFPGEFNDSAGFGWKSSVEGHDWHHMVETKGKEIQRLNNVYGKILDNNNVDQLQGRAKLTGPNTVEVTSDDGVKTLTAEKILIATGSKSQLLGFVEGNEHAITSDHALVLDPKPKKIVIYGAGYIACEFASIFAGFGIETHLFFRRELVLKSFDNECREWVQDGMQKRGVNMHLNCNPVRVEKTDSGYKLVYTDGDKNEQSIEGDHVMMATGRAANTKNLGLEEVGVKLGKSGEVLVDRNLQTCVPSIFALGDVINRLQLTPVALMEGMAFARKHFNGQDVQPDYAFVPSAVFTQPQLGTVGLSEEEAVEELAGPIDIYTTSTKPMRNTLSGRDEKVFMKLVVHQETDRVVGMHMVGSEAGEITQGFAAAIKSGLTKKVLDSTIGIHPSTAEELVTMRSKERTIDGKGKHTPNSIDHSAKFLQWQEDVGCD